MPCSNPVHPDGCPPVFTSQGACWCPCHECLDICAICDGEFDGGDGNDICTDCADELAAVPEQVDIMDATVTP